MKLHFLALTLVSVLILSSCKKGDTGPQGPAGPAGPTGNTGPAGPTGTANVIYSDWLGFSGSDWKDSTIDGTTRGRAIKYTSSLNQTVIDKATVLTYAKVDPSSNDIRILPFKTGIYPTYNEFSSIIGLGRIIFCRLIVQNGTIPPHITSDNEFRYVIIPGGVKDGRMASGPAAGYTKEQLKQMSYEQVVALFHIPASGTNAK